MWTQKFIIERYKDERGRSLAIVSPVLHLGISFLASLRRGGAGGSFAGCSFAKLAQSLLKWVKMSALLNCALLIN